MDYVSIKLIMDRITRHPLLKDTSMETVIDYTTDFIRIVGTPSAFQEKTSVIPVKDYRGFLPCDFYKVIQVRLLKANTSTAFTASTDSFHMSNHKEGYDGFTYKLQNSCIITSIPEGEVEIAYMAMPIDAEGYPLIPDNSSYLKALEFYIKAQVFGILFDEGKIRGDVLAHAEKQYAWYVGQAQTDLIRPTYDEMEAISNMWNKLLPDSTNDHNTGYKYEGMKEHIKLH